MASRFMNTHLLRWTLTVAATCVAALLTACGGASAEKLVESAKAYMAKGEWRPAVIELKSAIQKQPESPEARFLLGTALLAIEEPPRSNCARRSNSSTRATWLFLSLRARCSN
jgi:thioredoxin-like negative regulator of GroEL